MMLLLFLFRASHLLWFIGLSLLLCCLLDLRRANSCLLWSFLRLGFLSGSLALFLGHGSLDHLWFGFGSNEVLGELFVLRLFLLHLLLLIDKSVDLFVDFESCLFLKEVQNGLAVDLLGFGLFNLDLLGGLWHWIGIVENNFRVLDGQGLLGLLGGFFLDLHWFDSLESVHGLRTKVFIINAQSHLGDSHVELIPGLESLTSFFLLVLLLHFHMLLDFILDLFEFFRTGCVVFVVVSRLL